MRVQFIYRENGPEKLVCDAEIVFDDGILEGMKLVGFSLWQGAEGQTFVTFPSRAFGAGSDRKYFDFLRSLEASSGEAKRVKAWILEQYEASRQAA
jgi:hypothetical protein